MPLGIGTLLARYLRMRVGVTNFFFQGRVRASLHPLLNKMPVVGAVKVRSASALHNATMLSLNAQDPIGDIPCPYPFVSSKNPKRT